MWNVEPPKDVFRKPSWRATDACCHRLALASVIPQNMTHAPSVKLFTRPKLWHFIGLLCPRDEGAPASQIFRDIGDVGVTDRRGSRPSWVICCRRRLGHRYPRYVPLVSSGDSMSVWKVSKCWLAAAGSTAGSAPILLHLPPHQFTTGHNLRLLLTLHGFFISESKLLGLPCEFLRPAGSRSHAGGMGRPVRACLCMLAPRRSPLCRGPIPPCLPGKQSWSWWRCDRRDAVPFVTRFPPMTHRCRFDEEKNWQQDEIDKPRLLIVKVLWRSCFAFVCLFLLLLGLFEITTASIHGGAI